MVLGGCAGELSMKVSCASVWRKVGVEEEGAKFERTMTSVGDAGDFRIVIVGCRGEDDVSPV